MLSCSAFLKTTCTLGEAIILVKCLRSFAISWLYTASDVTKQRIRRPVFFITSSILDTRLYKDSQGCMSPYSFLREFTGFPDAALYAWKLTEIKAIITVTQPAQRKIHQGTAMW